ncbi:unnamed protein product [Effrenium voratum]|uniref:Fungal lipase-like domain-containing protein n=1 Tax=Effrenium voratum TaxID=2562239 RepID=A0AA36JPM9_9DINO|nr:unnamed protein product [Effrenium voratum]
MESVLHLARRRRPRRTAAEEGLEFHRLFSRDSEDSYGVPLGFLRSETQPANVGKMDEKLIHLARMEMTAIAKNLSMLDCLAEDLVKALDDLETSAHQVQLSQLRGWDVMRMLRSWLPFSSAAPVSDLARPLLRSESRSPKSDVWDRYSAQRRRFISLLNDALAFAQQNPDQDGVALFHQRVKLALLVISDTQEPRQVLLAVKECRRLFPFEVDPLEDMPLVSVYMCSLRIRWCYFFLCALFTALALFTGTITELFFAVFAAGEVGGADVWLSFWLLPFGTMLLALVGDEMGDLVIDAIDRPPLLRCLALLLAALQRDRRLAPHRGLCELVDLMLILLSEGLPFLCALRSFLLRRGFWHGYMQGGLLAAMILTLAVLLADVAICIHGQQSQQALRHIYHVLDKHKIFPGILSLRYELFRSHFAGVSVQQQDRSCQRAASLLYWSWRRLSVAASESWQLCSQQLTVPLVLAAWTVVSLLAVQDHFKFPVAISATMMMLTVVVISVKMALAFPDIAGPFYAVILIFFVSAAMGLQVGGAWALAPREVEPLMYAGAGRETWAQNTPNQPGPLDRDLRLLKGGAPGDLHADHPLPMWRGNSTEPPYAACRITWGSPDAPVSVLDLAALALIAYEVDCAKMPQLLQESFGRKAPRLEHCNPHDQLPRWLALRFPPTRLHGRGTRVFALKGTSSWRDVYADIKLFATIEVFQALSKIVPILSLLPVPLVQSIVGYTGFSEANMWKVLEEAIDSSNPSDVTVVTGHSLGGLIAQIVAARKHLPALVFSSPGVLYSARRFQISPESARHVVVLVPDGDVVSQVDEHAGVVQRIACRNKNGEAASTATCHYLRKTACELWRACGDLRGRDFSVTCDSYVAPETLGKVLGEVHGLGFDMADADLDD